MTLALVSVERGYSIYGDERGFEILIATTAPFPRVVVMWEDFDLIDAWNYVVHLHRTEHRWGNPNRDTFVEDIRLAVTDPDEVEVVWCESCEDPIAADMAESVNSGEHACSSCFEESYRSCDDCGTNVHYDDSYYTLHDYSVCERCLNQNYSHCDDCDGYYHDSDSGDHSHGGCDCESPALVFSMRNDGEAPLSQDERVTVALPSGVISAEGICSIMQLVRNHGFSLNPPQWADTPDAQEAADQFYKEQGRWLTLSRELEGALGSEWQTKEGNYTKRLSKLAYKSQGLKIPPAMLSQIGCIARDNSTGVDFAIEITRDLNLSAGEFYHEDSCWWQSYSESRCSLKSNGGFGMRTFGQYGRVQGRAWVMPLRLDEDDTFQPTFDTLTPDAFMIFNGYGDLGGYTPARIVAHMTGMTYRKVGFDCSPMYVNNGSGYLVTSEEIAAKYPVGSHVNLYADVHSTLHHKETRALVSA